MGYVKPTETTKQFLTNSPLPNHGSTYTVIPHKDVIRHTEDLLTSNGFYIERELYRANMNAQVAQGIYHIKPIPQVFNLYSTEVKEEEDLGMMFAWTNSYDKSTRFQCAIGGYVICCMNGLVSGDMATFARKHTGNADSEVNAQISSQIKSAHKYFKQLVVDKNNLRTIVLPVKEQAELLGRLFFDEKLLDVTQMSCIKSEMNTPSYDYKADQDNAWAFYNHVTHAMKKSHPRTWLSDQQKFHEFMVADVLGKMGINNQDTTTPIDPTLEHAANEEFHDLKADEALKADVMEENVINETDSEPLQSNITGENQSADRVHTGVEENASEEPDAIDKLITEVRDNEASTQELKFDDEPDVYNEQTADLTSPKTEEIEFDPDDEWVL